jgi:hypothetical protein
VYGEFVGGEHVEVLVDGVMVEYDKGVRSWGGSIRMKDGRGGMDATVVKCCKRCEAGGGRTYGVGELEARSSLDIV